MMLQVSIETGAERNCDSLRLQAQHYRIAAAAAAAGSHIRLCQRILTAAAAAAAAR
jgi:hypothetical protein